MNITELEVFHFFFSLAMLFTFQVLDLSFNDFKGPGFEPLESCMALQVWCLMRLYLFECHGVEIFSFPLL